FVGHLVENFLKEKIRFSSHLPNVSWNVNCMRKDLYLMCEGLCTDELVYMVKQVRQKCCGLTRSFSCEFMELNLMYWCSCECI
ncbi:hypothetical protein L9F63_013823, partial [Diploptera punctata]